MYREKFLLRDIIYIYSAGAVGDGYPFVTFRVLKSNETRESARTSNRWQLLAAWNSRVS